MGPLHRLTALLSGNSEVDVNNNKMGVKGKNKTKFASDIDIYGADKPKKTTYWPTLKTSKKNKGNTKVSTFYFAHYLHLLLG